MKKPPSPLDHHLDLEVSRTLKWGLTAAVAFMGAGSVLAFFGQPVAGAATPLTEIPSGLRAFDATAYLSLGILLLLATPALRVVVIAVHSARRRDWALAGVAVFVLVVLTGSVLLGRAE